MEYAALFLLGIFAARWLFAPLAALARAALFVLGVGVAYRVTALLTPEIAAINWRGFWSGAGVGFVVLLAVAGVFFYSLGWRARVAATEQEDMDRARQKAAKDRKLA